jgi:hypothetical protein
LQKGIKGGARMTESKLQTALDWTMQHESDMPGETYETLLTVLIRQLIIERDISTAWKDFLKQSKLKGTGIAKFIVWFFGGKKH